MAQLVSTVHVHGGPDGRSHVFGPGDDVPEWAARKMGAHCFEGGVHPYPAKDVDGDGEPDREPGAEPPRSGKGSGRDAWVAFAGETGHGDIVEGRSRDELIQALVDVGQIQA